MRARAINWVINGYSLRWLRNIYIAVHQVFPTSKRPPSSGKELKEKEKKKGWSERSKLRSISPQAVRRKQKVNKYIWDQISAGDVEIAKDEDGRSKTFGVSLEARQSIHLQRAVPGSIGSEEISFPVRCTAKVCDHLLSPRD